MNEYLYNTWLVSAIVILMYVSIIWIVSLIKKDAGIMDIFWGIGFIIVSAIFALRSGEYEIRNLLVIALVLLWGIRLALHIGLRNAGKPEDPRYLAWRKENGVSWWWKSYFKVFLLQGAVMCIVSLPLMAAITNNSPDFNKTVYILGIIIWLMGFLFESVADYQLSAFKKNPENSGKVFTGGLWKYSRHPNYFGEALIWWGFFMTAVSSGSYYTIISPLLMTFLLLKVSGVAMLDRLMIDTKPEYADYVTRTNAFFPGSPNKV